MNIDFLSEGELADLRAQGKLIGPISRVPLKPFQELVSLLFDSSPERAREFVREYKASKPERSAPRGRVVFGQGYVSTEHGPEISIETYRVIE